MPNQTRRSTFPFPKAIPIPALLLLFLHFHSITPTNPLPTCQATLHPELCVATLSTFPDLPYKSLPEIISDLVQFTLREVQASISNCSHIRAELENLTLRDERALDDCLELLGHTASQLNSTVSDSDLSGNHDDIRTLLSAAMTNQYTCLEGFAYSDGTVRETIEDRLYRISHHVSNSLALLKNIPAAAAEPEVYSGLPAWGDRRKLKAPAREEYDVVVAKDGSGDFTTINDALAAVPSWRSTGYVVYIKAGAYYENVEVDAEMTNLMFVGDGIGKTFIKGNRSVVDGWTTFRSATVAVVGEGFVAKGITIENYAGPSKYQAVALRSSSDFSAFYQCSFIGYQDTLYVHSLRQFYRDCDIYGTVDFIFGNAAAVLQNCNIYARKPNKNQKNIITAQGREDPNQNTAISILNSKIAAAADLIPAQSSFKTFLGRPWRKYSRTAILRSYVGDLVDPAGWIEWSGDFAIDTLEYREYMNRGPGSNTSARVWWRGYKVINGLEEAGNFTAEAVIRGSEWLNDTGIPYVAGLN